MVRGCSNWWQHVDNFWKFLNHAHSPLERNQTTHAYRKVYTNQAITVFWIGTAPGTTTKQVLTTAPQLLSYSPWLNCVVSWSFSWPVGSRYHVCMMSWHVNIFSHLSNFTDISYPKSPEPTQLQSSIRCLLSFTASFDSVSSFLKRCHHWACGTQEAGNLIMPSPGVT